jgi:hypothetical protein
MGLLSWSGDKPRKSDVVGAKNYLDAAELEALNRIVTAYLEFAELQAMNRKAMHMADWIAKLDDFLRLSDRDILDHAGKRVPRCCGAQSASAVRFSEQRAALPAPVEVHFEQAVGSAKQLERARKAEAAKKPRTKPSTSKPRGRKKDR